MARRIDDTLGLLLLALYDEQQKVGLGASFDPEIVFSKYDLGISSGFYAPILSELSEESCIKQNATLAGRTCFLTVKGIRRAEELQFMDGELVSLAIENIPAADRYVSRKDNLEALTEISEDLSKLRESIQENNEIEDFDREVAISEIASFEASIAQPRISAALIERFNSRVLRWIIAKFSDAAFALLAEQILQSLHLLAG